MRNFFKASLVSMLLVGTAAQADTFYNTQLGDVSGTHNSGTGTTVTNANGTVTTVNGPANGSGPANDHRMGAAPAYDTWLQENVGGNASVGITTERARDGNGSIAFTGSSSASKADLEYYFSTPVALSSFVSASYDWYRSSASTNNGIQTTSLRLLVSLSGSALIFEPYYQGVPASVATDQWITSTLDANSIVWNNNGLTNPGGNLFASLSDYLAANPSAMVYGLSTGIGSGWNGAYSGGVDNIKANFGSSGSLDFNFEVAVPEPASWAMMIGGFGLLGATLRRRTGRVALVRA